MKAIAYCTLIAATLLLQTAARAEDLPISEGADKTEAGTFQINKCNRPDKSCPSPQPDSNFPDMGPRQSMGIVNSTLGPASAPAQKGNGVKETKGTQDI